MVYEKRVTAVSGANVFACRGFVLPENASRKASIKTGPVDPTGPKIYKAPNIHEGNHCYDKYIIQRPAPKPPT